MTLDILSSGLRTLKEAKTPLKKLPSPWQVIWLGHSGGFSAPHMGDWRLYCNCDGRISASSLPRAPDLSRVLVQLSEGLGSNRLKEEP